MAVSHLFLTFLAKCLNSSVETIRPSLQSGFLYGFRHWTMNCEIFDRNSSLALRAYSLDMSTAAALGFFLEAC